MIINGAALASVFKGFQTLFNQAFEAAKPVWPQLASLVPSSAREEEYGWIGQIPKLREWIGDRQVMILDAYGYTIRNKKWESTIAVDRDDIEDDRLGIYRPLIEMMGTEAAMHPDDLVIGLLLAGFSNPCYDGQYFFDADHPGPNGSQSNVTDAQLSPESYAAARAAIMGYVGDHGRSLNIVPNLLVVGGQLESMGRKICYADQINGTTNEWKGTAELLVLPQILARSWFLLATRLPLKPLIFQQRKKPQFVALTREDNEAVFMQGKYLYGSDCRDNVGYGFWQMAYGSTGTGA